MLILKVISRLMDYPGEELVANLDEVQALVAGAAPLSPSMRRELTTFCDRLRQQELMDAQELYSGLFDRGRALSLLLFEHVHGESRDRGQAMVDLMALYQRQGFEIDVRELPDYIPLYLEYLSQRPEEEAREGLADVAHILGILSARLQERGSDYYRLFDALLQISGEVVDMCDLRETASREERDDTPEAMDKVWEEEQITFGAGSALGGGCSPQTAQRRPAPDQAVPLRWVENGQPATAAANS